MEAAVRDLMQRWSAIEPEAVQRFEQRWLVSTELYPLLQYAVQQAIAQHGGWSAALEFDDPHWLASISFISSEALVEKVFEDGYTEPAIALLSTYVQALEAFKAQGWMS